jgi:2-methylcitrate dehydratase PrpD
MQNAIANQLVNFGLQTKYPDIPKEIIDYSKQLALKTIAGMLAGSIKPSGRKLTRIIRKQELPAQVGVMGCGFKTSLWESVLLHSFFAHASELEDDRFKEGMGVTWDITLISCLFPLADKLNLSGRAFLEALVTGLEVTVRVGMFSSKHLGLGQISGAVGPVIASAKVLGLNAKQTLGAIGLAICGVPLTTVNYGSDGHFFESALQSLQAIMSVQMAKGGLAGNPDLATFLTNIMGKDRVVPEKIVEDLGKRWDLSDIWIKKYPACFLQHRQIDSVIEMKKQYNIDFDDVKAIEAHISLFEKVCDRPEPKDEGDLQFSLQHVLSSALLDGDVNMKHICDKAIHDPRFREARLKVAIVYHPELTGEANTTPSKVVIRMKNGREFSRERMYPIGDPKHDPLTREQVQGLYAKFSKGILKEKEIAQVADMVWSLENLKSMKGLINILVQGSNKKR